MASKNMDDFKNAARKAPADRNPAEQALVAEAKKKGMTSVNNVAHATDKRVRTYGH